MKMSILSNKNFISKVVGIIIGIIIVIICTYLIPFGDIYDNLVIENLDLTSSDILTKFVFKTSLIMIFIFILSYLVVRLIFNFENIRENLIALKQNMLNRKEKIEEIKNKENDKKQEIVVKEIEKDEEKQDTEKIEEKEDTNKYNDIDDEF